jgi:predicted ribosome quality control (RQC) complex YloA/Tae2 family protein
MKRRLDEAARALADLTTLAAEIDVADATPAALDAIAARARSLGVKGAQEPSAGPRPAKPGERLPYTPFRSASGRPILVGRGGADNDALTTKHARPHDLWLHAKGIPGAHVIVPLEKGESCPPELLVDAATLAAHFSDARGEAVCDVSYVERRHVRKPRKSAPGAVTFDREKVIAVRVEPPRLERLLATKEGA